MPRRIILLYVQFVCFAPHVPLPDVLAAASSITTATSQVKLDGAVVPRVRAFVVVVLCDLLIDCSSLSSSRFKYVTLPIGALSLGLLAYYPLEAKWVRSGAPSTFELYRRVLRHRQGLNIGTLDQDSDAATRATSGKETSELSAKQ
jgi:hypothetical protein